MWASYAAFPSESVSTRMIVAPETLASAACLTLAAVSPVSNVSSLRCRPHGFDELGAFATGLIAADPHDWLEPEPEPLAALATPYVPAATPNAIDATTTTRSTDHRLS